MDGVTVMRIDPEIARSKLEAYRTNLHKDSEETYRRAAELYEAAAEGLPLLDLANVFANVPVDANNRPRLAIARADRKEVCVWSGWSSPASRFVFDARARAYHGRRYPDLVLEFFGPELHGSRTQGYAPVPMVPADVRPETGQLRDWFILWEVERWSDRSLQAPPPTDPLLLKHLSGTIYAVLAEWDLTELERAVMAEALRR